MSFPESVSSFGTVVDNVDYVRAGDINDLYFGIENIESKIGIDGSLYTSTLDYQLANAGKIRGFVARPIFSYSGSNLIIGSGSYDLSGQLVTWNSVLTVAMTLTGTDWYYVYIDSSSLSAGQTVLTASNITINTTEPAYSNTKLGWYNGDDRCIFAYHTTSGALDPFYHSGDFVQFATSFQDNAWATHSAGTNTDQILTIPKFCTKALCTFHYNGNSSTSRISVTVPSGSSGIPIAWGTDENLTIFAPITDSSQTIRVIVTGDSSYFSITTNGFYLPLTL